MMKYTNGECKCKVSRKIPHDVWCWKGITYDGSNYGITQDPYDDYLMYCDSGVEYCLDSSETSTTICRYMFYDCRSLTALDLSNFDTSNVTSMSYMFSYCSSLTTLDVSNFDTSKVTDMSWMFSNCRPLTSLDVSNFDTSKVANMSAMFQYCSSLTTLDVSNFNTSAVTNMYGMFNGCSSLTTLDVSNFNTNKVTSMNKMFYSCPTSLKITCKTAFRDWCITNASTIYLPKPLRNSASTQWHIVD